MEFLGTKGTWRIIPSDIFETEVMCGKIRIAQAKHYNDGQNDDFANDPIFDEGRANALLISKAPELLEMLKEILRVSDEGYVENYKGGFSEWENELAEVTQKAKELIKEATEF